jgi:hypothetical protein
MKKTILCFNFLMMFVLYVVFTSCKTVRQTVNKPVRIELKHDRVEVPVPIDGIPTLVWYGVQEHTIERYHELKECGINYNFSSIEGIENLAIALDAANVAGVMMIVHVWGLENEPEIVIDRFRYHPALAGYWLKDEPNLSDFSSLGVLARRIQAIDSQHFCYANIFPNYASSKQLGTSNYLEYVQLFLNKVPVSFLSFDHYPIYVNDSGERSLINIWYENLKIISDEARKAGKPFWAFAQTTAFDNRPVPTLADLRLQVYSNLAYGAQGIQYYTYWTFLGEHDAPIDYDTQQKTATWYTVQQMNKEIKALSNVFLGAEVLQVRHIVRTDSGEDGIVPVGTTRFDFTDRPVEANIIKTFIIPNNTNAVVSFLKNGNRCYMVVVNRNLEGGDNVTFTISGGVGLQLIKKDGTAVSASKAGSTQTVTPGDVLIYGWNK